MHQRKHNDRTGKAFLTKGRLMALLLVVTILAGVGVTTAWLADEEPPVENIFVPAEVTTEVGETFADGEKSDVVIQNTGDVAAYIRAAVIVTWQNEAGEVLATFPTSEDYTLSINTSDWALGDDGFYYHTSRVDVGGSTTELISSCSPTKAAPKAGYYLNVEVLGSGIQADGVTNAGVPAVVDAWGSAVAGISDGVAPNPPAGTLLMK